MHQYKKKIVCLYSNTYSDVVGPYWGEEKDQILIEPEFTKERPRPSFSAEESPKSINDINLVILNYQRPYKWTAKNVIHL